jgi:hypothetical protein
LKEALELLERYSDKPKILVTAKEMVRR